MPYNPPGVCPQGFTAPPCALKGGPIADLQYGPTGGFFHGAEVLETVPGPTTSNHQYGKCTQCGTIIQCDLKSGRPVRAN